MGKKTYTRLGSNGDSCVVYGAEIFEQQKDGKKCFAETDDKMARQDRSIISAVVRLRCRETETGQLFKVLEQANDRTCLYITFEDD